MSTYVFSDVHGHRATLERVLDRLSPSVDDCFFCLGDMVDRAKAEGCATDVGMVVGLTNASGELLEQLPDAPLLIPGFGAQGGDIEALAGSRRAAPSVVNVSRGILYREPELSFADKAARYAESIRRALGL